MNACIIMLLISLVSGISLHNSTDMDTQDMMEEYLSESSMETRPKKKKQKKVRTLIQLEDTDEKYVPKESDLKEPSVSDIVLSLFKPSIQTNYYNKSESLKHTFNRPQKSSKLSSFLQLGSWTNGYKEDMQNFEKLDLEK